MSTARNIGMGGVGIGNTHPLFLSIQNPALLAYNSYYTTALAGFSVESRGFATTEEQDRTSSGGFDYLSVAFPIVKNRMGLNLGLAPYSTVSYSLRTLEPAEGLPNSLATVLYEGSGGLTQAYVATGINVYKGFSVGARVAYLFGNITEEVATSFVEDTVSAPTYTAHFSENTSFSDVLLTGAISYRKNLDDEEDTEKGKFLMAGLVYELETNLNAERVFSKERVFTVGEPAFYLDTVFQASGSLLLPASIGVGASYGRTYSYTIGADVKVQNWANYRNFESGSTEEGLGNSYRVAVGGEWTPDYISRNYLERMTYRTGIHVEKTPFIVNGQEINEFGINFGLTFPVGVSGVHTSFSLGQRGTTDNNLIRERFFRVSVGVSLNERWFERYKYD